ncbi:MAG: excinuclease ABC subunit UvrC [Alphaproteobacteria bacterium]|nr:excinuclease ABC subunit UvrC [Alphaproteobacteria bacterium]
MSHITGPAVFHKKLPHISHKPGVYRMLDAGGAVLYVGKAKDLRKRLTNYTLADKLTARIAQMVQKTADIAIIETAGETEALLLENDLIKQYRPPYNILLKDDKSFPYIVLTDDACPRVMKYRGRRAKTGSFFGPFASGAAVSQTLNEIQKVFGIRSCTNSYFAHRTRPCLQYQMKRCLGPCCRCVSDEDYRAQVAAARDFLLGNTSELQQRLTRQMQAEAAAQNYERAAALRDKITALNQIQDTRSGAPLTQSDIVAVHRDGTDACIQVFFYRSGRSEGNVAHFVKDIADITESLESFLMQFYDAVIPPAHLLVSERVGGDLAQALSRRAGFAVSVQSGGFKNIKRTLMRQAVANARRAFKEEAAERGLNARTWDALQRMVRAPKLEKIEVFDNSHIQGAFAVGAQIVATRAGFQKKLYRKYNIGQARTDDDFGMMREVMRRRLARGLADGDLPDLFLIDGGRGQLSSVLAVRNELGAGGPAVMAMAKGANRNAGNEIFYLGDAPATPVVLDGKSDVMHLLQRLRDEAHRFAVGSHRAKRAQNMLHSSLTDIGDIGGKRKKALMLHFGSARAVAGASVDQLMRVPGISRALAEKIYAFYHG